MASELGLGITPWSPLKSGVLSGKYTRENAGQHNADRGAFVDRFLNEKTYAVVDELEIIAKAHDTTVARVALAWVHAQPRRLVDDHRRAPARAARRQRPRLDVKLSAEELARLDALTKPRFGFPQSMQPMVPGMIQRRNNDQRRLRADLGIRDARRRPALLRTPSPLPPSDACDIKRCHG